jgi:HPt (histidine-containing phosphotransfer) domain-containing protein
MLARVMGDEEIAGIIVGGFVAEIPGEIEMLKGFVDAGDAAGAGRQAHSIKGASANVGGEALRAVAFEAEKAGQTGDLDTIMMLIPNLVIQFDRLKEAMRDFADKESTAGEPQ